MKIFIGFDQYPFVAKALSQAGATLVSSLEEAEGFVFTQTPGTEFPTLPPQIKWVQLPNAGINAYFQAGHITPNIRWSNASGVYGGQVAEAAIALLLGLLHCHPTMVRADSWEARPAVDAHTRWLSGSTVAIVGAGGIGRQLSSMLKPFGARTLAVTRTGNRSDLFDETLPITEIHSALSRADAVVLAVPLTDATRGMMSIAEFRAMKPGALLINVARGEVVDTQALITALDNGWIAGAGLDVSDPEPLPDGHTLWGRDNVLITPHTANTLASMDEMLAPVVSENYRLLLAGERMRTEVDVHKGY